MKQKLFMCGFALCISCFLIRFANAEVRWGGSGVGWGWGAAAAYGYPYGYWGYGGGQTPEGAAYTGMANLVRAQGEYDESAARAAANYEQARSIYIDNQRKLDIERQRSNRERTARISKRQMDDKAARDQARANAEAHRPPPLASDQFNASSGQVNWPKVLMGPEFNAARQAMEQLLQKWVSSQATSEVRHDIIFKAGEMKDVLRKEILNLEAVDYSESRKFLDSLIAMVR
jgi:hypothetical protein